jgi:hypothetical protein
MVSATAVMAPAMPVAMAALDLDDGGIGGAERSRCRARHCRRGQVRSQCESAGGKSDQQEPFHFSVPSFEVAQSRQGRKSWELLWFRWRVLDRRGIADEGGMKRQSGKQFSIRGGLNVRGMGTLINWRNFLVYPGLEIGRALSQDCRQFGIIG